MTSADSSKVDQGFLANAMASFIQIGAVLFLLYWCFTIIAPFIHIVVWGLIISVALYPAHVSLTGKLGGREKLSAALLVLVGLAVILVPTWYLADSTISGLRHVATDLQDGAVSIPPPDVSVADWPLVGDLVHAAWSDAATNFEATLNRFAPQLKSIGQGVVSLAGSTVLGVLQFVLSVIIAGAFLTAAAKGYDASRNVAASLIGTERGNKLTDLSILTIRSVTKGVLGVAIIQAILSAIGLLAIGVPAAGLWAGAVLVLAIIQLPPLLVLGPIAIWVFSTMAGLPATLFLVYAIFVSASDAFLKPMLMGRGVDVPVLVILIGAIGGAMSQGIIGLFTGAVVLALGYEIITAWMAPDEPAHDLDQKASPTDR
jgi:predicted PurR-regulated permease PerM